MSYLKKVKHEDGTIEVVHYELPGVPDIFVEIFDESDTKDVSGEVCVCLTPRQARDLAKALKKAAKRAEAGQ